MNIMAFDVETNGLNPRCSVLSISSIKGKYDKGANRLEKTGTYCRYYYIKPGEKPNPHALAVNGLYEDEVEQLRKNADYARYFKDDIQDLKDFAAGVDIFVAHNIKFDRTFIPFITSESKVFCTMMENAFIKNGKWPKLFETAHYYDIPVKEDQLHGSMYDTELCFAVLQAMIESRHKNLLNTLS